MIPGIAIDRSAGKDALSQVVEQGRERLGRPGWWSSRGTRVAPGATRRYKPAGPSSPSALASRWCRWRTMPGEFWRRNAFIKRPGEIVVASVR